MTELIGGDPSRLSADRTITSAQLKQVKEKIMKTWESRVRGNVTSANEQTGLILRNMFPELIDNLVDNLTTTSKKSDFSKAGFLGKEHGEQRAALVTYTLSQVVHEYRILRQVVFEVLEEEKLPGTDVRDIILNVLDEGIQKAIEQFSTVRSRALIQSNRDLEYFAAIAAHDLKAPLATISGYMELLDENLQNKISFEDAQYIKTIKKSTAQMTVLIDRLLEYSSIGRKVEPFAPLFVSEVVQRATDNLRELITSTSAKVIFKDVPQVTGEISLLTQLFQNLINNAIKFRDPKRVPEIRIEVTEHDSEWIFSVRDNGIGFKPEDKEHIFSLFKKSHSLQTQTGYGIGLATARKVVELHGGKIWAESEPGIGSTFYFTIAKTPW